MTIKIYLQTIYWLRNEDIDKVKICLALGVDINTCDRQGKTAITLASLYQQYACVQALIDAGANINKQDHTCLNPF